MGESQTDPTQKCNKSDCCRAGVSACCPRLCCPTDFGRPMLILRNSSSSQLRFVIEGLEIWKIKFPCNSGQNMKASCLVMTGPKTMKKHWVFLIFSSKHVVLLRKSWCFWVWKAIRDPGWPHQFRAAKKNIEKPWVFELYFWQPSSWPAKLSS